MFVRISPIKKQVLPKKDEPLDDVEVLTLAPFTANPKLFFNDVVVGNTVTKKLLIINPSHYNVNLMIKCDEHCISDYNFQFNWRRYELKSDSETFLEITWSPTNEASGRFILSVEDGGKITRDVPVAFKAIKPIQKKTSKPKKKIKYTCKKYTSPTKIFNKKISPKKRPIAPIITVSNSSFEYESFKDNKENFDTFSTSSSNTFYLHNPKLNIRRETYTLKNAPVPSKINLSDISNSVFEDSLENISPNKLMNNLSDAKIKDETPSFSKKLASDSFAFTPILENDILVCSTEEKSNNDTSQIFSVKSKNIFENIEFTPITSHKDKMREKYSSDTYVLESKANFESYLKQNVSLETFMKGNISSSTYVKDNSIEDIRSFTSPIIPQLSEINNKNERVLLESIYEESSIDTSLKRKSNCTFNIVPQKRKTISNDWSQLRIINENRTKDQTNIMDPFMSKLNVDDEWINDQEIIYKKWLNALLTPRNEGENIDIVNLYKKAKNNSDIEIAPTKESVSLKYFNKLSTLNSLRKIFKNYYKTDEISIVITRVKEAIENNRLVIRTDKNINLDLELQKNIRTLFSSYNSLWLRLGLETIYNETIPLISNSDISGLNKFISERFFKDPNLLKKYKYCHNNNYIIQIKKNCLKIFLSLIYLLDQAKIKKLIPYEPCLFCKNAIIKESKEILLKFSSELIQGIGDITKFLKARGYILQHQQTYINEFNFAVNILGVDLRDGIRLMKILEIILLKDNLMNLLRIPPISRLQKIHNITMVFTTLKNYNFDILSDISPEDIVNGHREKTFSFLWQLIYKLETPLMNEKATIIQKWWHSEPIQKKLVKLTQQRKRKENSAIKIQSYVRMYLQKKKYNSLRKSIIKIQQYSKGWIIRKYFKDKLSAVIIIQKYFRSYVQRMKFLELKYYTIIVQKQFRANKLMKIEKNNYNNLKEQTIFIQRRFRANKLMKYERNKFLIQQTAIVKIQRWIRSIFSMKKCREYYILLKIAVSITEERYLAKKRMKSIFNNYQQLKSTTIFIQRKFRAKLAMIKCRNYYKLLKQLTIIIQRKFRALLLMKQCQKNYQNLKKATKIVQNRFRANVKTKIAVQQYRKLKNAVFCIEQHFLAKKLMNLERNNYQKLKYTTIYVQQKFKAKMMMISHRNNFNKLKKATILIQRKYKAKLLMNRDLQYFQKLKKFTIKLQQIFRSKKMMKKQRDEFLRMKNSAIIIQRSYRRFRIIKKYKIETKAATTIQRKYRATLLMRNDLNYFNKLKLYTIKIQILFRAKQLMKHERNKFLNMKRAAIIIQRSYRKFRIIKKFKIETNAATTIQRKYRATLLMRNDLNYFNKLKLYTIKIQILFRAKQLMKHERNKFVNMKRAAIIIQRSYRKFRIIKKYKIETKAAKTIQRKYRATLLMRNDLNYFNKLKLYTIKIQILFRAKQLMKHERNKFLNMKRAAIIIQRSYRKFRIIKKYKIETKAAKTIQRKYRATLLMRNDLNYFNKLKLYTIKIQILFRAKQLMKHERNKFVNMKRAAIIIQRSYRKFRIIKKYKIETKAAKTIQRKYRATLLMRNDLNYFNKLKLYTIKIQILFRAKQLMKHERNKFVNMKRAAIIIQRSYRKFRIIKKYKIETKAAKTIQRKYRATLLMRNDLNYFNKLKLYTIKIQILFRAKQQRKNFLKMKKSACIIQRCYRKFQIIKKYKIETEAAITIQKYVRRFLVKKIYGHLLTKEEIDKRKELRKMNKAAVKIQAFWKGFIVRRSKEPKLIEIYKRAKLANAKAVPEKTLKYRCEQAVIILTNFKTTLKQIILGLTDIEFIVRHCKITCIEMSKTLIEVIYVLITSTGRSHADMNICTISAQILIHFCKLDLESCKNCCISHYMDGVLTTMLHWCDKDEPAFPALSTLVWLIGQNENNKEIIKKIPNFQQKILKMQDLVLRKHRMVSRLVSLHIHTYFTDGHNLPTPSLVPDWGLDLKERPLLFLNSVQAMKCLLQIFDY